MREFVEAPLERLGEPRPDAGALRGTNQSGMRAHNERLVLSLLRRHGPLAKSDIARISGLSVQTVSVIMRQLEQEGLLGRGEPIRGRIGQPSVPMHLAGSGAFFFGLKVGRRSADLVMVDFLGQIRAARRRVYRYPTPSAVIAFVAEAMPALIASLPVDLQGRVMGMGVAIPFQLWNWVALVNAPQAEMDAWRDCDIGEELAQISGLPVHVRNDATSACGAELVFGRQPAMPRDFLYFYFGTLIGGGLVINGQLFLGRTGNAAGLGPMRVPGPSGGMQRLLDAASLSVLADAMEAQGIDSDHLWQSPESWTIPEPVLSPWLRQAAEALANASLAAATLVEIEAVLIDGWMPASLRRAMVAETSAAFSRLDHAGVEMPLILEGSIGPDARALGAAAVPLSQRYLLDGGPSGLGTAASAAGS